MTPTPSTGGDARADLLERLKAATGPFTREEASVMVYDSPWPVFPEANIFASALQGSLDAALALVERAKTHPFFVQRLGQTDNGRWLVTLVDGFPSNPDAYYRAVAPTAPLAILVALLSALPADSLGQEETVGE